MRAGRGPIMVVVLLICAGALLALPKFGSEFLPEFREGHFVLQIQMAPGTSLPEMLRMGAAISDRIAQEQEHCHRGSSRSGRAEQGEDTWGPHRCEFHVELKRHLRAKQEEGMGKEIRGHSRTISRAFNLR